MTQSDSRPQSTIEVLLNFGHRAKHRAVPHERGFTHDWTAYVVGAKGIDIKHFVEKVVFTLHETFDNPVQERTEPPYSISESGYASFTLNIDVYFKNDEQPNKMTYSYDLYLPGEGQPMVQYFRQEKLSFKNTPDNFRQRLLRGGAEEQEAEARLADEKEKKLAAAASKEKKRSGDPDEKVKKKKEKKHKDKSKHKDHKKEKTEKSSSAEKNISTVPFGLARPKDEKEKKPSMVVKPQQIMDESSSSSSSDSQPDSPTLKPVHPTKSDNSKSSKASNLSESSSDDSGSEDTRDSFKNSASNVPKRPATISDTTKPLKRQKVNKSKKTDKKGYNGGRTAQNGMALDVLLDLHEKIRAASDPSVMQRLVDTIEDHSTGQYKISESSFDFDLCKLEPKVIHIIEGLFR